MKLGTAFSDSLIIEKKTESRFGKPNASRWWLGSGRALLFTTILFVSLFVLAWRLFDLTIIRGHEFRSLAEGNRTRELIRHAPRGRILDRTGRELAQNESRYRQILPCQSGQSDPCTKILTETERDTLVALGLPKGSYIENDYIRLYPAGQATSPVVGYTGEISREELAEQYYQLRGYRSGDRIGRMGIEAVFEARLRGRDGRELVEINVAGTITRTLGVVEEVRGEDVTISLDRGLAHTAMAAFPAGEKGAIVVSRPITGEILALYTSPSFDANIFSTALPKQTYDALFENPDLPMFNRGIGGVYPPGSTFKIATAIAGLEEGAISANTLFEDIGELVIGRFKFPNWYFIKYGKTDGLVDILKAIQRSNDIYFYKAGEAVGITKLAAWAKRLGIGTPLGIEIPGEAAGLMPDPAWKALRFDTTADREARNDQWYLGDTYHVAIGQGYLLTTPLQVNAWTNVVANRGNLCRPTIEKESSVRSLKSSDGCKDLGIKKGTIDLITEGMKRACEPGGTGWPLFEFGIHKFDQLGQLDTLVKIPVACKTGTAEFGDPQDRTHAWFTAFAPIEEPEISVTVLVEGAGEGSDKAAPIAKKILEEWFQR